MNLSKINTVSVHIFLISIIIAAVIQAVSFTGILYFLREIAAILSFVVIVPSGLISIVLSLYSMSLNK